MPHKFTLDVPEWVEELADVCLQTTVEEALWARHYAVRWGALEHKSCRAALASADATLQRIADRRVIGNSACKKAADALRKYNTAAECAHPTARAAR